MMSQHIQVTTDAYVRTITFDRPKLKNALTPEMYVALTEAIESAKDDPSVRVLLFRGAEGTFTSGNDISTFLGDIPTRWEDVDAFRFIYALAEFNKPIIAAVDGYAVGVGATMLLHADLVYASEGAQFRYPFVDLGVTPEAGSSVLLPLIVGRLKAAELIYFADKFDAQTALRLGLINEITTADALHGLAHERALRIASKAPNTLRRARALLRRAEQASLREYMEYETQEFLRSLTMPEAIEAVTALMTKRTPDFSKFE